MTDAELRLNGIYRQAQQDRYFLRAKLPAGTLDAARAEALADLADELGEGTLHLTTRMSVEVHGILREDLEAALARLAAAGLTSRGACGGAVRGVALSTPGHPHHTHAHRLATRIQTHFTGNDTFEGLPKKFKVGVDADYRDSRHLIQDAGFVYCGEGRYDVWLAGGLGRKPTAAFLYRRTMPEAEVLPFLEAVVRTYARHTPKGKRLKHLVAELGAESFAKLLQRELGTQSPVPDETPDTPDLPEKEPCRPHLVRVAVFAGQLGTTRLRSLLELARRHGQGTLVLTPDQDVILAAEDFTTAGELEAGVAELAFGDDASSVVFTICPGTHQCQLGLGPTRDVARELIAELGPEARRRRWAIAGCPNGCAQPQLADYGVVCTRREKLEDGSRRNRFDLLRREGTGLGKPLHSDLDREELIAAAAALG